MYKDYLNPYVFFLLAAYLGTTFAMEYGTASFSLQGFVFVSPIILGLLLASGRHMQAKRQDVDFIICGVLHERDIFLISYSFIFAILISLMTQYDNSDAKGWWGIALYFNSIIGFIFALFYAYFNQLARYHDIYTNVFSTVVLVVFSLYALWPSDIKIMLIGTIDFYWAMLFLLGFLHLSCFFLNKAYSMVFREQ